MTPQEMNSFLTKLTEDLGISHFGWVPLQRPLTFDFYKQWLSEGLQGDMTYLVDHAPIKENPQQKWPRAESALVFAMPYFPHPEKHPDPPLKGVRMSLYSQGMDYHLWFKDRMTTICNALLSAFPDEEFLPFTDSNPILERDLARRAGLGWVGKNTCLIHPKKGSLFFIGEIYASLKVTNEIAPLPDFCGNCTRCIDICPTGALIEPRKMDARKCISYLTIESRKVPPEELREQIGDWFFGCDLCQTVCPWNQKIFKGQLSIEKKLTLDEKQEQILEDDLRYILTASGKKISKDFVATPFARAGSFGLKKNALIVVANRKIKSLAPEVSALLTHEKLGELAQWTLLQLSNSRDSLPTDS